MQQIDNPDDVEGIKLTVKSDYDSEDKDWLVSVRTQNHWLKHLNIDLARAGFTWKSYDQNHDIFSKFMNQQHDPLEEQAARLEALIDGYSSVSVETE